MHDDGHGPADGIADGRTLLRIGQQVVEFFVGAIGLHVHLDVDLLVAGRDAVIETEQALKVDVPRELRRQLFDRDAACHGMKDEGRRHASRERMEQELDRIGALVVAEQNRRLAGRELECLGPRGILLARTVEVADGGAVLAPIDPGVSCTELEPGEALVGLECGDRVDGGLHVEAIEVGRFLGDSILCGHGRSPSVRFAICRLQRVAEVCRRVAN
mgnify:CR=1 FL=1